MPIRTVNTKFYTFRQNNSGGRFHLDENLGVFVIVEATDHNNANARAARVGMEFDRGCPCCGDRWDRLDSYDEDEATEEPTLYGKPVRDMLRDDKYLRDFNAVVHYYDGSRIEFKGPEFKTR